MKKRKGKLFQSQWQFYGGIVFTNAMRSLTLGICMGLMMGISFGLFDSDEKNDQE